MIVFFSNFAITLELQFQLIEVLVWNSQYREGNKMHKSKIQNNIIIELHNKWTSSLVHVYELSWGAFNTSTNTTQHQTNYGFWEHFMRLFERFMQAYIIWCHRGHGNCISNKEISSYIYGIPKENCVWEHKQAKQCMMIQLEICTSNWYEASSKVPNKPHEIHAWCS